VTRPLVATLTGGSWTPSRLRLPANAGYTQLAGVSCAGANACTAVGYYTDIELGYWVAGRPPVQAWDVAGIHGQYKLSSAGGSRWCRESAWGGDGSPPGVRPTPSRRSWPGVRAQVPASR
jgi:hypothetical protein